MKLLVLDLTARVGVEAPPKRVDVLFARFVANVFESFRHLAPAHATVVRHIPSSEEIDHAYLVRLERGAQSSEHALSRRLLCLLQRL